MYQQEDILESFIKFLRFIKLWPKESQKFNDKSFIIQIVVLLLITSTLGVGTVLHLIHTMMSDAKFTIAELIDDAAISIAGVGYLYNATNFILNIEIIESLLKDIGNFQEFSKPNNFDKMNKRMNLLIKIAVSFVTVDNINHVANALILKPKCEEESRKLGAEMNACGLYSQFWLPFNWKKYFIVVWALQTISSFMWAMFTVTLVSLIFSSTQLFITRIQDFKDSFQKLHQIEERSERLNYCRMLVAYHVYIIEIADKFNQCFGKILLMFSSLAAMIISMFGMLFFIEPSYALHGVSYLGILFIVCLSGQRLLDATTDIPLAVYSTDWYDGDIELQKSLQMIIMKSNEPLKLDADGFGVIGMEKFTAVVKLAYSILTFFHQSIQELENDE